MIDIRFLRENPDIVRENIKKKFQDEKLPLVDEVIELDNERRTNQQEADDLRASRNKISKEIGALMAQGKKVERTQFTEQSETKVMTGRDYDMTIIGHAEPLDINIYARHPYYFNYENAEVDATIAAIAAATTTEARAEGYHKAQEIIATDLPALFLYSNPKLGVWDAGLEGVWENGPVPSNDMTDVRWTNQ